MVAVTHLISPASLPSPVSTQVQLSVDSLPNPVSTRGVQLSVLSYNVLLPNSVDGWWNYKMYLPPLTDGCKHISEWEYRRKLLRDRIGLINADVVCLQEVSPKSFQDDFDFMQDLGYDGVELFKRGRFRPATFYKSQRCELVAPAVHKDRTLLTTFRLLGEEPRRVEDGKESHKRKKKGKQSGAKYHYWHVLNCHLQAGKEGGRRVRQINDGVRSAMTLSKKLKEENLASALRLIVCGDFNGGSECGAVRFLEDGFVDEDFREDGEPVASKKKTLSLSSPLVDVMTTVQRTGNDGNNAPPPTLVVPELISLMVKEGTIDTPELAQDMMDRLERIYKRFATHSSDGQPAQMNKSDVEKWLIAINGMVGRGSEFRAAAREMGWKEPEEPSSEEESEAKDTTQERKAKITLPPGGILTLEGFVRVYEAELRGGKFWGIAHDMAVLDEPLPDAGVFSARYDRLYCSASLVPTAVLDTVCMKPCPNDLEPSDHLPVAATFEPS